VASFPHDPRAFTQGLLVHQGKLYESTGLLGRSTLRRVAPASGVVEKSIDLASNVFAEGLALVGDRLFQLTWQNHVAYTYDLDFRATGRFDYTGEGWGLCYDGERLVMSDGSSKLFFRHPTTFAVLGEVEVHNANGPVRNLNELECVGSLVYANVWQTDLIVHVDPASGDVLHTIDASGLLTASEAAGVDVLNGIAHDPATGHFYITGKLWPKLFEVRFAFDAPGDAGAPGAAGAAGAAGNGPEAPVAKEGRARGGCGCAIPGAPGDLAGLSLFASLALALKGVRRRRTSRNPR
jgi:glutaminyl-peptide cyclotransferase